MIAVDTNLLVYAHRRESRHYQAATSIMRELAEGNDVWAIPWPCCYEFLSVVTNPRIWKENASSPEQAWRQLSAWTASPSMRLIGETEGLFWNTGAFRATSPSHRRSRPRRQDRRNMRGPRSRSAPDPGPRLLVVPGTQDPRPHRQAVRLTGGEQSEEPRGPRVHVARLTCRPRSSSGTASVSGVIL